MPSYHDEVVNIIVSRRRGQRPKASAVEVQQKSDLKTVVFVVHNNSTKVE
jgi:hypothetical protein